MLLLLLTFFLSSGPALYIVVSRTPSTDCSPFRYIGRTPQRPSPCRGSDSVYALLAEKVDTFPTVIQHIINFIFSASFGVPVLALLAYYRL